MLAAAAAAGHNAATSTWCAHALSRARLVWLYLHQHARSLGHLDMGLLYFNPCPGAMRMCWWFKDGPECCQRRWLRQFCGVGVKRLNIFAAAQMPVVEGLTWTLPAALGVTVVAAQLEHRVPCWGYVLREHDPPARPNPARLAAMRVSAVRPPRPHGHMAAPWRLAHTSPRHTHAAGLAACGSERRCVRIQALT